MVIFTDGLQRGRGLPWMFLPYGYEIYIDIIVLLVLNCAKSKSSKKTAQNVFFFTLLEKKSSVLFRTNTKWLRIPLILGDRFQRFER